MYTIQRNFSMSRNKEFWVICCTSTEVLHGIIIIIIIIKKERNVILDRIQLLRSVSNTYKKYILIPIEI